ncbi:hypothetical protein C8Q75DRAFT_457673 [Abortiporus biennis]|nr:hypothetical protein C8Q75DRAFT_457673 [Abortiporus biennis]
MANVASWLGSVGTPSPSLSEPPATLCGCGPNCVCPGCIIHRGSAASPSPMESCANPGACNACLDCNMLSLPLDIPPDTPLSRYEASQFQSIDDWIRQMSTMSQQQFNQMLSSPASHSGQQPNQFDPTSWQTYALWSNLQGQTSMAAAPEECCGGRCGCPVGMCTCTADCCGCCQGCQCPECEHPEDSSANKTLTFATSGERSACCGGSQNRISEQPTASTSTIQQFGGSSGINFPNNVLSNHPSSSPGSSYFPNWSSPELGTHRAVVSRASSSSSRSSSPHSHSSSSHASGYSPVSNAAMGSCCTSFQQLGSPSRSSNPAPSMPVHDPGTQHRTLTRSDFGSLRFPSND